jgi:hypothetical protein
VRLGEHTLSGVRCQVRDLGTTSSIVDPPEGRVAGVLGIDVLRHFVMEIDPVAAEVTLTSPIDRPVGTSERLRREGHLGPRLLLRIEAEGRHLTPVLDTGADQTWVRGKAADLVATQVETGVTVRGTGAPGGVVRDLTYYHLPEVGVGGYTLRDLVFIDRSNPWWSDGLLGLDVIGRFHGIYDLSRRRYSIVPAEPAAIPPWQVGQPTPVSVR